MALYKKRKRGETITRRKKSGQAAIEYLITYGWTILIIIVTFGLIIYFDVLSPSKFLPLSCEFGEQIKCVDMRLVNNGATSSFSIKFLNNFPKTIVIQDMKSEEYTISGCKKETIPQNPMVIDPSMMESITCDVGGANFYPGDKKQMRLFLEFKRNAPSAPLHEIRGSFVARVEK